MRVNEIRKQWWRWILFGESINRTALRMMEEKHKMWKSSFDVVLTDVVLMPHSPSLSCLSASRACIYLLCKFRFFSQLNEAEQMLNANGRLVRSDNFAVKFCQFKEHRRLLLSTFKQHTLTHTRDFNSPEKIGNRSISSSTSLITSSTVQKYFERV